MPAGRLRPAARGSRRGYALLWVVQVLALLFGAIALIPAGAHLFALPAKFTLDQTGYFTVQQIYRGWSLFGIADFGALVLAALLAFVLRRNRAALRLAATAATLIALTLVVFFLWTYPANQATQNWTMVPSDWEHLRARWEYSHGANAVILFVAFCCIVFSVIATRARPAARDPALSA